jgi:hypothetical protein
MNENRKRTNLETLAAAQLIRRMLNNEATLEELGRATSYMVTAAEYDAAVIKLDDIAEKTGIKELAVKYSTPNGVSRRSGRYPWKSADEMFKELLNMKFGLPSPGIELSNVEVGDKIVVNLKELGEFEATAHEVTDESILFIFDDYITERPMNENNTNAGGYEESDLKKWIENELFNKFPWELKTRLTDLTLPTVGQVFGWDDEWDREHFESDGDEQLPLMELRKNRVAYLNNELKWGWLRNAMKKEYSSLGFATVTGNGGAGSGYASSSGGVRPAFRLVK